MAGPAQRSILHIDLDAFYASVEELDHPQYRGLPLIVAGLGPRGVVSTCSYAARKFGVRSAMPTARARRLCPDGIYVQPRMARYQQLSAQVFEIMGSASPQIEALSLDEAFLDVAASQRALGSARQIAERLQHRIRNECGLGASIGIAPNKLVAKLASEAAKPGGIREVAGDEFRAFLDPLPLSAMWGVGKVMLERLHQLQLRTVADLLALGEGPLASAIGSFGHVLFRRCQGLDERPVESAREGLVISSEHTFDSDLQELEPARQSLMQHCERICQRAREQGLRAHQVSLKLRRSDFSLVTRQTRLEPATARTAEVFRAADSLLAHWWQRSNQPQIRLLGAGLADFAHGPARDLFGPVDTVDPADTLADAIGQKFGAGSLRHARGLAPPKRS